MASLVLAAAGSAIGASFGGVSILGASITGSQIGGAIGALAGAQINAALMPASKRQGARLADNSIQSSTEGAAIARLYGRMRLSGQVLWASRFKETSSVSSSGKGMTSSAVETTSYAYSISFAVGLCEGVVTRHGRIWADGNLIDPTLYTIRFYPGDETQTADPLIEEIEGSGNTPSYRGVSYVVFEDMPLADFGNRIPQLQFEVVRALNDASSLETLVTSVALIPGAGEFVYAPEIESEDDGEGTTSALNAHNSSGGSDWSASLDELQALAPSLHSVSLVVGWFGNDLRAGVCTLRPGVEESVRSTYPDHWSVAGIDRASATLISRRDGRPAYGGTPSDNTVLAAIADLKARGIAVTFYPFVFMDVAEGNALPDPYSDNAAAIGQPAFPWRGRITVSPAAGFAGTVDQTAQAETQVNSFFSHYRSMVLHYAALCAEAGGVDSFLIGSELIGLTTARSDASIYPAVAGLKTLAAEVRALLPAAKLSYGADWSEYHHHDLGDGALCFHLDPLWSDANIDFIGVDNYLPLADWRDGTAHLDAADWSSVYDTAYLTANIQGGEYYDWYYASTADRETQTRTPITDGLGKPWVWRVKDLWSWWSNLHYDRPSGTENILATAWVPQSKPIRFTELGCPAVDKGANQPNVFYDPKSSESAFPYFSSGDRDDRIQRAFLAAHLAFWADCANNPISSVTGAAMLDTANLSLWCWDARPYPFFPARDDVWGDCDAYITGHWLNGRLGTVSLPKLVETLCDDVGFTACDTAALSGQITGFAVADTQSVRDSLSPLMTAYAFDAVESGGVIRFVPRGAATPLALGDGDLVPSGSEAVGFSFTRAQESDLPAVVRLSYADAGTYERAVGQSRRLITQSLGISSSTLPLVLDAAEADALADRLLQDAWVMRESASLTLPPSRLALDPTDEIALTAGDRTHRLRLTAITDTTGRKMEAIATDPSIYESAATTSFALKSDETLRQTGRALLVFLDLPLLSDDQSPTSPCLAAFADPWPGAVFVYKDGATTPAATITTAASLGTTLSDFYSGPQNRWDRVNTLAVKLLRGSLSSATPAEVFAGANALAIRNGDGEWEIIQFATAELTAPQTWTLSHILRGRQGSEFAMRDPVAAGARVVVLNSALMTLPLSQAEARLEHTYLYGPVGKPLADAAFQTTTQTFTAAGLIPPAPCHVRHAWQENGDLTISWFRRDRAHAANCILLAETPQSDADSYDLEILNGETVVRSFSCVPQHSQIYTATQQAADFPAGLSNPLKIRVFQRSSVLGRGRPKTESLYVR